MINKTKEYLEKAGALLNGHFLLTSGRHAGQYMQCAKVMQYPNYTEHIASVMAHKLDGIDVDMVVAPAVGGIIIGYELAKALGVKSVFAERVMGKMELRRGFVIPKGTKVVIAEDVVTTGLSIADVKEIVTACQAELVAVAVIVDRTGGDIDVGVKFVSAYSKKIISYEEENCPYCKEGTTAIKPGSRGL